MSARRFFCASLRAKAVASTVLGGGVRQNTGLKKGVIFDALPWVGGGGWRWECQSVWKSSRQFFRQLLVTFGQYLCGSLWGGHFFGNLMSALLALKGQIGSLGSYNIYPWWRCMYHRSIEIKFNHLSKAWEQALGLNCRVSKPLIGSSCQNPDVKANESKLPSDQWAVFVLLPWCQPRVDTVQ
jgi:hypothetical protein